MIPVHAPLAKNNNWLKISIKLSEPKLFTNNTMQACAWLSTVKRYVIAIGLIHKAINAANTLAACQYVVTVMAGNTAR